MRLRMRLLPQILVKFWKAHQQEELRQGCALPPPTAHIVQCSDWAALGNQAPDFDGLEEYMAHVSAGTMGLRAPKFSKFIAEQAKTTAVFLKQLRLSSEEKVAKKSRKNKKNKGKGDGKGDEEWGPLLLVDVSSCLYWLVIYNPFTELALRVLEVFLLPLAPPERIHLALPHRRAV